jgi:transcriptional regulator with XRE-family HTH domain
MIEKLKGYKIIPFLLPLFKINTMYVGHKIKNAREKNGIKQEEVALELGISQKQYSLIESNQTKLTVERLLQISKIIKTPAEELISDNTIVQNNYNGKENKAAHNYYDKCNIGAELIEALKEEIKFLKQQILVKDEQLKNK